MNRELKFRIYDKEDKKMREVWALTDIAGGNNCVSAFLGDDWDDEDEGDCCIEISYPRFDEVMQYIGMSDKNGVEMYEGDIVHHYFDEYRKISIRKPDYDEKTASKWDEENPDGDYLKKFYNEFPLEVLLYVKWDEEKLSFRLHEKFVNNNSDDDDDYYEEDWYDGEIYCFDLTSGKDEFEVIGNIYEI